MSARDCLDDRRRHEVRRRQRNGLDYLEVSDDQRQLTVFFLGPAPEDLTPDNVRITGGRRIRDIRVVRVEVCPRTDPELDNCMVVTVDRPGDFSTYRLCLVDLPEDAPFDPRYLCVEFSFKVNCPTELDCAAVPPCPPELRPRPEISYLVKDYASFRRLIMDRLSLVMPEWTERHAPDLGVTLVELLAYVGDHLSYYQDAVGTEAYLDTARQRISVRRHARLVDYRMHEGCNARAWVHVDASTDVAVPAAQLSFLTPFAGMPRAEDRVLRWDDLRAVPHAVYDVFRPLGAEDELRFYAAHNEIRFYTWGNAECCLPRGATSATLVDGPAVPPPDPVQQPEPEEGRRGRGHRGRGGRGGRGGERGRGRDADGELQRAPRGREQVYSTDEDAGPLGPRGGRGAYGGDDLPRGGIHAHQGGDDEAEEGDGVPDGLQRADDEAEEGGADAEGRAGGSGGAGWRMGPPPAGGADDDGDGRVLRLRPGDVLVLEEVIGPGTGVPDDADPARRHAVRLTRVERVTDDLYGQPLLEVEWAQEDALPFPLCLSVIGPAPACRLIRDVSVARGNVVLADHGRPVGVEALGCVPVDAVETVCEREGRPSDPVLRAGRFRPVLAVGPLTFSQPLPPGAPAARLLDQDPRQALPAVRVASRAERGCGAERDGAWHAWTARPDLLASGPGDDHFVVEMDDFGRAHLRFGNGDAGRAAPAAHAFSAAYRVGNGPAGNVGADALTVAVTEELVSGVELRPRNPLPARGGTAPEPVAEVKLFAPHAFRRVMERAVTADDYARLAERYAGVQRAAGALRFNGSWYEVQVAVDPLGRAAADPALLDGVETHLHRYRRIGHDLAVRPAEYVALDLVLEVCVGASYLRGNVRAALLDRFGAGRMATGSPAFFNPDELTFGVGVPLSRVVAAAQALPGVDSVSVVRLERLFQGPNGEIERGVLPIGPAEIARLDSDPDFPENGRIRFELRGGR